MQPWFQTTPTDFLQGVLITQADMADALCRAGFNDDDDTVDTMLEMLTHEIQSAVATAFWQGVACGPDSDAAALMQDLQRDGDRRCEAALATLADQIVQNLNTLLPPEWSLLDKAGKRVAEDTFVPKFGDAGGVRALDVSVPAGAYNLPVLAAAAALAQPGSAFVPAPAA